MELESIKAKKFRQLSDSDLANCIGGVYTQGSIWLPGVGTMAWQGDYTERCVGSTTNHSSASVVVYSGGTSTTSNCYQYDFNGTVNGVYMNSGWGSVSCVPIPA